MIPKIQLDIGSFFKKDISIEIKRLIYFIRKNNVQIVQTFFQDSFLLGSIIKVFCKIKLIGSFRDLGFWRSFSANLKMRAASLFYDEFIANSLAVKAHFSEADRIPEKKIHVIYNGFEYKIQKEELSACHDKPKDMVLGIVSNLNRPVKRVSDFLKVASAVLAVFPDVKIVVVGDGHLKEELQIESDYLCLGGSIEFVGRVENPIDYIRTFSVGAITSETEGFCNSIIEYMAAGVPVVATDIGGNRELVKSKINGYLVPVGNVDEMSKRIIHLLKNPDERKMMAARNIERIKKHFTVEKMVREHERLYERCLYGDRFSASGVFKDRVKKLFL
jgi:glycosyltransferase involved in cell wall biosynthesis